MEETQVPLLPGQTKHVWCYENTLIFLNNQGTSSCVDIIEVSEFPPIHPPYVPSQTPTNTQTSTPTPTPTATPLVPVTIELSGFYFEGSVGAGFLAVANQQLNDDVTINFTNVLGTIAGPPLLISSSVEILSGETSGYTQTFTNYDYSGLTQDSSFTGVTFNVTGSTQYIFTAGISGTTFDVTPTPTNTETPTPTPTPNLSCVAEITFDTGNAAPSAITISYETCCGDIVTYDNFPANDTILFSEDCLVIGSVTGTNVTNILYTGGTPCNCIPVTPTATPTPTNTPTSEVMTGVTPTVTATVTPTPSPEVIVVTPTETQTPTPTPTNTPTETQTPTPTPTA